jgi:transposase
MRPSKQIPQEELFPFVSVEKLIPKNHILRLVDRYVDFSFVDKLVEHTYSDTTGCPAKDPELIIRIITIGYLFGLSERKLFEELNMHAAYRWFCNLGFNDKAPDRSTLNKLKNHRWARDGIFGNILQCIVLQCVEAGLVSGKHIAVAGTKIRANASIKSFEPIVVEVEPGEYFNRLKLKSVTERHKNTKTHPEDKDFHSKKLSNETHRSTTDPDSRLYKKSKGQEASLSYIGNNLIDTKSRVTLATKVTQPGITTEVDAALDMLDSLENTTLSKNIDTLAADSGYGSTLLTTNLFERGITPHIPLLSKPGYEAEPTWKTKTFILERLHKRQQKIKEVNARNKARNLAQTSEYKLSQTLRKRIEHIFGKAKNWHGLSRARGRGIKAMQQQLDMTAVVQNIKRPVGHRRRKNKNVSVTVLNSSLKGFFMTVYDSLCNLPPLSFVTW